MDGTLLNSMQVWINFSPTFCKNYGIEWSDDIQNAIMTMSFVEAAEYFCDNYHTSVIRKMSCWTFGLRCWMTLIRRSHR